MVNNIYTNIRQF